MTDIPFIGVYEGRSKNIGALRFVNLFPILNNAGNIVSVIGTPGLSLFVNTGAFPTRAFYEFNDNLYGVEGNFFYKIDLAGNITILSSAITTNSGDVSIACNGIEILFVDGQNRYVFDIATEVLTVTPDSATSVAYIDGVFLKNEAGSDFFYISNAYDGLTWDPANKARCETSSDNLIRIFATYSTIFMLGEVTTEIWYNAGTFPIQFQRMQGGTMNIGCLAQFSVVRTGNTGESVIWLAKNSNGQGFLVKSEGGPPAIISTKEVEHQWSEYVNLADATAYSYKIEDNTFYVISFPAAGKTWAYNLSNGSWLELSSEDGRHRSNKYAFFNNKHVVSDYEDGNIYKLEIDHYTDNGAVIKRKVITPHLGDGVVRHLYPFVQLDIEAGVGLSTGQGNDPQVMIRFSNNRGHTWGNEHWVAFGKIGEYGRRAILRRTGTGFWRTYELTISDPVKIVILNLKVRVV